MDGRFTRPVRRRASNESPGQEQRVQVSHNYEYVSLPEFISFIVRVKWLTFLRFLLCTADCAKTCPKGLNPGLAIAKIKKDMALEG